MPKGDFYVKNYNKIEELSNKYNGFPEVSHTRIERWLNNFDEKHKNSAISILKNLEYFDVAKIFKASKEILKQVISLKGDLSNVVFSNLDGPGKSGEYIKYQFRVANNLPDSKFISLRDIPSLLLEQKDTTIVFLNDFIGTGGQAIEQWQRVREIIPEDTDMYLGVIAAFRQGIENVHKNTTIKVLCYKYLDEKDMIFSQTNNIFTSKEKEIIKGYCTKTGASETEGYGKCQALVVFPNRTPNNSIPILCVDSRKWKGLFPRYYN